MCICPCIVRPFPREKPRNAHKKKNRLLRFSLPGFLWLALRCPGLLAYTGPHRLFFSLIKSLSFFFLRRFSCFLYVLPRFPLRLFLESRFPRFLSLSFLWYAFPSSLSPLPGFLCLPFSHARLFTSFSRNPYPCRSPLPGPSPCFYARHPLIPNLSPALSHNLPAPFSPDSPLLISFSCQSKSFFCPLPVLPLAFISGFLSLPKPFARLVLPAAGPLFSFPQSCFPSCFPFCIFHPLSSFAAPFFMLFPVLCLRCIFPSQPFFLPAHSRPAFFA